MLERLARWCYHRRRMVLLLWIVAFVVFGFVGKALDGGFSAEFRIPGSDSTAAQDLLKAKFPQASGDTITVAFRSDRGVDDASTRQRMTALFDKYRGVEHVIGVESPYDGASQRIVSQDGTIARAALQLDIQGPDMPVKVTKQMIADAKAASTDGLTVALDGQAVQAAEFVNGGGQEGAGILAAIVILLITFGSVLAMGLPILTAIMGIGIGLAIIELLANFVIVPNYAPIVAAMIGIGVGIDYALFIVTRYRHGLQAGMNPEQATVVSIATAGRAVLFAGTTVVISVMGMLLMNLPFLQGVSFGAAAAVLVTMLGSVTLLPAMLGFTGRKIDAWRVPLVPPDSGDHRSGFWFRWSRMIQRRPWPFAIVGLLLILVLAAPMTSMKLGFPGEETESTARTSRQAYDLVVKGFGPGYTAPFILVAQLPDRAAQTTLLNLQKDLGTVPGVAAVTPPQLNAAGDTAVMTMFPTGGVQDDVTKQLVRTLRHDVLPREVAGTGVRVRVGGPNAAFLDVNKAIANRLPIFIGTVVLLSFILLLCVFRSPLVALKAAIMNLLSIAAAYGVLVAVVQWGWGKDLFGIRATSPITNWIPMLMFAVLFGLSMDYEVFLLSRVREEYVISGDNSLAVADGLAKTARVITAAAAIMIMVFMSFVLGPELAIKQVGLGLAVAILIDATVIRMVLVPSTMELLGKANWWLPGWLDRILPRVAFEAPDVEPVADPEGEELEPALL